MQEECELYVDPEEDEVFFGCISDKERSVYAKVSKHGGGKPYDCELKKHLYNDACNEVRIEDGNESFNVTDLKLTDKSCTDTIKNETLENADSSILRKDINGSINKDEENSIVSLSNTSVELDHNYSTPMKQKIDKSILSTPKSIVKADKDGGFLKVLSEIALVKAEADKKTETDKKGDEDKENQIMYPIPEIKITEASPEKISIISPQSKNQKTKFKKFKMVYNSPRSSEKVSPKKGVGAKALAENFESTRNLKNKCLDKDMSMQSPPGVENIITKNGIRGSREFFNKSVNLIEFDETHLKDVEDAKQVNDNELEKEIFNSQIKLLEKGNTGLSEVSMLQSEVVSAQCNLSEVDNEEVNENEKDENVEEIQIIVQLSTDAIALEKENSKEEFCDTVIVKGTVADIYDSNKETIDERGSTRNMLPTDPKKNEEIQIVESSENTPKDLKSEVKNIRTQEKKLPGCRFSKEARKIVEGLKKAAVDDTLNFTIQEIDVENTENSFISPEPVSCFDETLIAGKNVQSVMDLKKTPKTLVKSNLRRPKTVEASRRPFTPILSQSKIQSVKYQSDRKVQAENTSEVKKCAKKLTLEEKRTPKVEEKFKGCSKTGEKDSNSVTSSRIPVFGLKACKTVATVRVAPVKTTPFKSFKSPKFKNIESPINAYIHNKPTALVVNVKPESKKDGLTEVWKKQTLKKVEESKTNVQIPKKIVSVAALPFVQYKSATPYKVEKRPESRLPRLAPNIQKLIGNHSPRVLKHEGRFYVKTPRQQASYEDSTILADGNEVSMVVSQVAQKSNTIK